MTTPKAISNPIAAKTINQNTKPAQQIINIIKTILAPRAIKQEYRNKYLASTKS